MLDMMLNGGKRVTKQNLNTVIAWYKNSYLQEAENER